MNWDDNGKQKILSHVSKEKIGQEIAGVLQSLGGNDGAVYGVLCVYLMKPKTESFSPENSVLYVHTNLDNNLEASELLEHVSSQIKNGNINVQKMNAPH